MPFRSAESDERPDQREFKNDLQPGFFLSRAPRETEMSERILRSRGFRFLIFTLVHFSSPLPKTTNTQPSTPTLVQHGFTVAAAAAAAATERNSSDSDSKNAAPFVPGAEAAAPATSTTPPPPPPPPSLGALGAALASADAEAEEEEDSDDSEAYDAFSSSGGEDKRKGKEREEEEAAAAPGRAAAFFAVDVVAPGRAGLAAVDVVGTRHRTPAVRALARSVVRGLCAGARVPVGPSPKGLGGSYVFSDERGRPAAIVKPCDEEPLAPNNPKGFVGRKLGDPGLRPTVRVGQAALREVAAYLLDHGGFARVPPTVLVRVAHPVFHVAGEKREPRAGGVGVGGAAASSSSSSNAAPSSPLASAASAPPSLLSLSLGPLQQQQQEQQPGKLRRRQRSSSRRCPASLSASAACKQQHLLPKKLASLQQYVRHDGDAADAGASRFSVRDVHAIGILDIRLLNSDRHAGNLLVRRRSEEEVVAAPATAAAAAAAAPSSSSSASEQQQVAPHPSTSLLARFDAAAARAARDGRPPLELVPIDHGESRILFSVFFSFGFSFRPDQEGKNSFLSKKTTKKLGFSLPDDGLEPLFLEWLHWPQSSVPFSQQELEYISSLDGDADAALLARELPDLAAGNGSDGGGGGGSCLRTLSISTRLLQRCAAAGLTLADIGALASRPLVGMEEEPSQLERVCWGARAEVDALKRASAKASRGEEENALISAAVDKREQELLLLATATPEQPRPLTVEAVAGLTLSSLGAVSTPALLSEGAALRRGESGGGKGSEGDSSSSSPPLPPLSFVSSLDDNGSSSSAGGSRSNSGGSLPPPLLPLASQASTQSHPEDLLFEFEGAAAAAAANGQKEKGASSLTTTPKRRFPDANSSDAALASPPPRHFAIFSQQSLNPATGGAWSPMFRGSVLLGSSAESAGGGSGGLIAAAAATAARPSSSFGSLPPTSPRPLSSPQQSSLPPTSPGSYLRGAPLGTSLARAGGGIGGGGGATAAAAANASDNAAAAGFARRPATARERLRARALAVLGGSSAQKKIKENKSVCFTGGGGGDSSSPHSGNELDDDDGDSLPPPGVSSAKVFAGLEGDDWAAFVEAFDERVCAALRAGIWRNIAASS